jgi:hypothetical protein
MPDDLPRLRQAYASVKSAAMRDCGGTTVSSALLNLVALSMNFLASECAAVPLTSLVPDKTYFAFSRNDAPGSLSRPVNTELFDSSPQCVITKWDSCMAGTLDRTDIAKVSYTVALAPCLAMELFDRQNKKGPATYFESLVGHIFAKAVGVNPRRKATFAVHGRRIRLTMDFIFDLETGGVRVHLPVKMSTRERVVQAWAHQRILDAAFGEGEYTGIMVLFSETKLDIKKREVVEICVPDQWLLYQSLLSRMARVYYFDVPARYQALSDAHPDVIQIKQFGNFFIEKEQVLSL